VLDINGEFDYFIGVQLPEREGLVLVLIQSQYDRLTTRRRAAKFFLAFLAPLRDVQMLRG